MSEANTIRARDEEKSVLVLDLDQTLLKTDALWEMFLQALSRGRFSVLLWPLSGKARFKQRLASLNELDLDSLPWNEKILRLAEEAHAQGGTIWLATAADQRFAQQVVRHFNFFSGALSSDGSVNRKGALKADALVKQFGEKGFAYAGDASCDLDVWKHAHTAYVVGSQSLEAQASRVCARVVGIRGENKNIRRKLSAACDPGTWLLNLIALIPLLTAPWSATLAVRMATVFLILCAASSAGSIFRKLLERNMARNAHHTDNPFAGGEISLQKGVFSGASLLFLGTALSLTVGLPFFLCMICCSMLPASRCLVKKEPAPVSKNPHFFYSVVVAAAGFAAVP